MSTPATEAQQRASAEELLQEAEPWESWESQLVGWSIGIGFVGLIVLGLLINIFLL
jgi:hypothetical protein